jgi:hypothetical protein
VGNKEADKLARRIPGDVSPIHKGLVFHAIENTRETLGQTDHWLDWFAEKSHHYTRKPSKLIVFGGLAASRKIRLLFFFGGFWV